MSAWRTILVSKPCRLSMKNRQLVYEPKDEASIQVPLEDITVIVLETNQSSLTTALLSHIAENNIALFTCDNYHMPSKGHIRMLSITDLQYSKMETLVGVKKEEEKLEKKQLLLF